MNTRSNFSKGENGHLTLHGVDLVDLCSKYGTPLFVFDQVVLVENFDRMRRAFESTYPKAIICYSVKTNNNLTICATLKERGAYAEVSSELDLRVALKAGFKGDRIIFDGPFKPKEALHTALEEKVLLINVESFTEMERLDNIAGQMGVKQAIGLRINPFKDPGLSKYTSLRNLADAAYCHLSSRFGFSLDDAYNAFKRSKDFKNLTVEGIMTHPYHAATEHLLPVMKEIRQGLGIETKYLNIGGGFDPGVTRTVGRSTFILDFLRRKIGLKSQLDVKAHTTNVESVAKSITDKVRQGIGDLPEPTIVVEPGRFITAPAGFLLVRVDHVRNAAGYKWVMVDGGTNILPNSLAKVELREVFAANKASERSVDIVNVVGPLLYPEDFIAFRTNLPKILEGDIISISGCGAYTLSMSNQFLHPRPAAVLLNLDGEVKVIRGKETFEDFLNKDAKF